MVIKKGQSAETGTPPASTPQGVTPAYSGDHSFTLQATMEMQKTLGKLENAVTSLVISEKETKDKLGRIEKIIYAAGVVLLVVLGIGGWMLNTAKDFAMTYYKAAVESQKPASIVVPPVSPKPSSKP